MTINKLVFTKEELEEIADAINAEFFPERLKKVIPLDPYLLLDKLGCQYEWARISPELQILGISFFGPGYWYIWPEGRCEKGDRPVQRYFSERSVIINSLLLEKGNERTERFAVTHEGCHWIKDQNFFKEKDSSMALFIRENFEKGSYWEDGKPTVNLIEVQNNYLTAAVLMPRGQIKDAFFHLLRYKNIPTEPIMFATYMKKHIATLAKMYGVNFNVVLYRLQSIGVLESDSQLKEEK